MLISLITNNDKKLENVLKFNALGERIHIDNIDTSFRENTEKILGAINPIIQYFDEKTASNQISSLSLNFEKNYEELRIILKEEIFKGKEDCYLDRHKVSATIMIAMLAASRYPQKETGDLYEKYSNEICAWYSGITVLLNFILDDLMPEYGDRMLNYAFNSEDHIKINKFILGYSKISGNENKNYINYILMILNMYNHYERFDIVSILNLSHSLYLYEIAIKNKIRQNFTPTS